MENLKKKNIFKTNLKKWHKKPVGERIVLTLFFIYFWLQAILQFIPFLWVINNSLKNLQEYSHDAISITTSWEFVNYVKVFQQFKINGTVTYWQMLGNSMWQTFVFLGVNIFSSLLVAYPLAKFEFPGRNLLYAFMIFIQTVPIVGTGAAAYKFRYSIGMVDNPWLMWISWAVGFDFSAFLMYGTFQGVSNSYAESAEIDGANEWQIFFKVMVPQIFPLMIALMVTNFISRWGDYSTAQIYLPSYPNLAYGMYLFQLGSSWAKDGKVVYYASIILSAIPGVILYSVFQRTIITNVSVGGLKG